MTNNLCRLLLRSNPPFLSIPYKISVWASSQRNEAISEEFLSLKGVSRENYRWVFYTKHLAVLCCPLTSLYIMRN